MSKKRRKPSPQESQSTPVSKESASAPADTRPGPAEKTDDRTDKLHVLTKCWGFFWSGLTTKEKLVLAGILFPVVFVIAPLIFGAGFWLSNALCQSKVQAAEGKVAVAEAKSDRQAAKCERDLAKIDQQLRDAKAQLAKSASATDSEPTIETARFDPISFGDFVSRLNEAREQDDIVKSALVDQYRWKKVRWDCVIVDTRTEDAAYYVGTNEKAEKKDQAFAQFGDPGQFDRFLKRGDCVTMEGVFKTADDGGIVLYDCRLASETPNPVNKSN